MSLNHKQKITAARRMLTADERAIGVIPFKSLGWRKRAWQIAQRVHRQELHRKYWSQIRKRKKEMEIV